MATVTYSRTLGTEFTANSYTTSDQLAPDALALSNGGHAVAYNNEDEANGFILINFYDAAGVAVGGYKVPYELDNGSTWDSTDAVGAPRMTQLSNGNVVVTWADANNAAGNDGIRQTILTETGAIVTKDFVVSAFGTDRDPEVTALTGGGYVITYQNNSSVFRQIFDNDGGLVSGETLAHTTTDGIQTMSSVAALSDGGFVVVFQDDQNGSNNIIRARVYDANGAARSVNGSTNDFPIGQTGENTNVAVAGLNNGNFAIAYQDTGWDGGGITLTIYDPNAGDYVNYFTLVNTATDTKVELDPDITVLENGFIVVSWSHEYSPTDHDIYYAVFTATGERVQLNGDDVSVITSSVSDDTRSSISSAVSGHFIAAWQDTLIDGSGGSIRARTVEVSRTTESDDTGETLDGDALRDIMNGNLGNDILDGMGGNDVLTGGDGNDRLIGNTGADQMTGGKGNDAYYVDNAGDLITEVANQGTDTVRTTITYQLTNYVENLILQGSAGINGTGNSTQNTITGNGGNNTLDGKGSGDTLIGGLGDDIYVVDHVNDVVTEKFGEGHDTVKAYSNHVLGANVEDLTLSGTALNGGGNDLNNTIKGNSQNNIITGGDGNDYLGGFLGNDRLTGGAGADIFLFNTAPNTSTNRDQITDFNSADDTIRLDDAVFSALSVGVLGAAAYAVGTSATGAGDRIIYDSASGSLYYDSDGVGGAAQVRFAILQAGLTLSHTDFVII